MEFYEKLDTVMKHFSKTGGFLTVKNDSDVNTMTISWGFIGYLWGKPYFICVVRPTRHTFGIIENCDSFTVSVPFGTLEKELGICGVKSGRDINKGEIVEYIPSKNVESPVIKGCDRYFECKINYKDKFHDDKLPDFIKENIYKSNDNHTFYIGEIVEIY